MIVALAPPEPRGPFPLAVPTLLLSLGTAALFLSYLDLGRLPPLQGSVGVLWALFALGIWRARLSRLSLLARLGLVLYALPLLPTVGYLLVGHYHWWPTPLSKDYQDEPRTLEIMAAIGLVGMAGLLTGLLWASISRSRSSPPRPLPCLGMAGYTLALALAFGLSWLSTPAETILVARYAVEQSEAAASGLRFDAAFLAAYVLLCLLLVDAHVDAHEPRRRRTKVMLWIATTGSIVAFHQVLRGNRECAGLVAATLAYAVTAPGPGALWRRRVRRRMIAAGVLAVALLILFVSLGVTRTARGSRRPLASSTLLDGATQGTWTAVLLTDLSLADRVRRGELHFRRGQTYVDYLRSVPPGFVADALGWKRPLESTRGPAHLFLDVSAGGCHLPIVPFLNFGWWGEFLILALYGWMLGRVESWSDGSSRAGRFAYTATFTFIPLWFWYGDMYAIRGVMLVALCWVAYRGALFVGSRRFLPRS
jgi:hypothetical protein